MELERCYSVLTVSSSLKFNESIRGLLPESRYFPVMVMRDAASARRELLEQSYDLVIINAPLTDEFGTRLALDVCDRSGAGVLLTAYLVSLQKFDLLDEEDYPCRPRIQRRQHSEQFEDNLARLCKLRDEKAEELGMEGSFLITRASLEAIAEDREKGVSTLLNWQREALGF